MEIIEKQQLDKVLHELLNDAKNDYVHMMKGMTKGIFRSIQPSDFKDAYLSISQAQGEALVTLIKAENLKHIVEFGTSFGISTLFLARGVLETGGTIITTELIESKAQRAIQSFKKAGVANLIEVRIGDAMETLKGHDEQIDLLLLDGWKDLYLPLFRMLEANFHTNSIIYVDNADMSETRSFLKVIQKENKYHLEKLFNGKVVVIRLES